MANTVHVQKYERYSVEATIRRRERARIKLAIWRKEHPEQWRAQWKAYRQKNRDKILERQRGYYRANPARYRDYALKTRLKSQLGLTPEQMEKLIRDHKFRCAICKAHQNSSKDKFHIDHDHKTGKVRGYLCPRCNHGLGHFKDNPELLIRAAEYLKRETSDCE